eukprot:644295-Pleurochrysis_carterae.AAC.2
MMMTPGRVRECWSHAVRNSMCCVHHKHLGRPTTLRGGGSSGGMYKEREGGGRSQSRRGRSGRRQEGLVEARRRLRLGGGRDRLDSQYRALLDAEGVVLGYLLDGDDVARQGLRLVEDHKLRRRAGAEAASAQWSGIESLLLSCGLRRHAT